MKYFKIENQNDIVLKVSDTQFASGSGYYQISSSTEYLSLSTQPGHFKVSGSSFMVYSSSADLDNINDLWIVQDIYSANVIDYKKYRSFLKVHAYTNTFASLSQYDKNVCAQEFAAVRSDRNTVYSLEDQIKYGYRFHKRSVDARQKRIEKTVSLIYNRVQIEDGKQIVNDVLNGVSGSSSNALQKYKEFGIEGLNEGDLLGDGLFDYIESRVSSSYSGSGLLDKNFIMLDGDYSIESMSNDIMDILKNGNYNPSVSA